MRNQSDNVCDSLGGLRAARPRPIPEQVAGFVWETPGLRYFGGAGSVTPRVKASQDRQGLSSEGHGLPSGHLSEFGSVSCVQRKKYFLIFPHAW